MGSRGQSMQKERRRAEARAVRQLAKILGGGNNDIHSLERKGDQLYERIGELLEEYRDERGFVNSEETEKDPRIQEARKALNQIDSELLDRVAKPIQKSALPKGVEGDDRNSELDWDMAKINAWARELAAEKLRFVERTGSEAERKRVWDSAVKVAISRAEEYPYDFATNYRPQEFASGGRLREEDRHSKTTYRVLRVYSDKRGKKVEFEVKHPYVKTPEKVREYIRYDENHNEYIWHAHRRLSPSNDD